LITDIGKIGQIGIVVRDLEKSMKTYWEQLGIGPWKIWTYASPMTRDTTYYGKPAVQKFLGAETMVGDMNVELLMHLEGETIYRDFIDKGREGLHHVSIYNNNLEPILEKFQKAGIGVIQSGKIGSDSYYYLDTEKTLGILLEVQTSYGDAPPERIYPDR